MNVIEERAWEIQACRKRIQVARSETRRPDQIA